MPRGGASDINGAPPIVRSGRGVGPAGRSGPELDRDLRGNAEGIRLQKVLAAAGVGSRRACEQLIDEGRVSVNGRTVLEQGRRVDPERDTIAVDGLQVPTRSGLVYLAVNKPFGMLSTMSDDQRRPCLGDLVENFAQRLFHVGRLDMDTEGLILLTNDGDLAHRLTHPSFEVSKTYLVEVEGVVPRELGRRLLAGISLEDGPAKVDSYTLIDAIPGRALIEVVLHEGRNRIVRRMFEESGFPVVRLVRTAVGPIQLGDLRPGRHRHLTNAEVGGLVAVSGGGR